MYPKNPSRWLDVAASQLTNGTAMTGAPLRHSGADCLGGRLGPLMVFHDQDHGENIGQVARGFQPGFPLWQVKLSFFMVHMAHQPLLDPDQIGNG